jgi:hypothetical protein
MLHAIASAFIGVAAFISSLFGVAPQQELGAALPSGTAVFETSLQSRISSTDTSLTLTANSVRGGSALAGYNCFTIDEGRTDAEYVCGSVSGTSVTSLTRGIDASTGTTSNSTLKFAHRVGANVKITDFPLIQILRNQANGSDTYPTNLRYATGVVPTSPDDLTDKGYVDGVAFSGAGVIDATTIAKGVSELATGCEAASSTSAGTSGPLVIPASGATSTRNAVALSACKVVVANNNGLIDDNFISTSTLLAATSTSIGAFPAWQIGKQLQVFSSTGTTTFPVPAGITKVGVWACGGGGGGSAGGGAGAACVFKNVDITGTTSIQVFVGSGGAGANGSPGGAGTWSTFGTNGFYLSAAPGSGGSSSANTGVVGPTASTGDLNFDGGEGYPSIDLATDQGGRGGDSQFGHGGRNIITGTGSDGRKYGGGGGGTSSGTGGSGAQGIVFVSW